MIDVKNNFSGGIDLDSSYFKVGKNSYVDALNITRDAIAGNADEIISNIVGNRLFDYASKPTGTNKFIGGIANTLRNTIIACFYNSNSHNYIVEYDLTTRVATRIFESLLDSDTDILGFTATGKVTGMNIYNRDEGDLFFFLDTLGRPTYMDIELFKTQEYSPVTRDIIDVCLRPPLSPITAAYGNDTTKVANNFYKKLTRYRFRWIYDDFGKSCYSTISAVPLPVNILSPAYTNITTNNNLVNLTLNSGPKNVSKIELDVSISENSNQFARFQKVIVIDKSTILLFSNHSSSSSGTTTTEIVTFGGYIVTAGTIINIYLTLLPATQTLVGTYTVQAGDNITSIVLGLIASIGVIGIATVPTFYSTTGLTFNFDNILYSFDQVQITLPDSSVDDISFSYPFYNDGTYPFIDDNESLLLYDLVPDYAEAQDFPNGNTDAYGNITEGYDKDLEPNVTVTVGTVASGSSSSVGTLSGIPISLSILFPYNTYEIQFNGTPATGTVVTINLITISGSTIVPIATYTTLAGDTIVNIVNGLVSSMTVIGIAESISSSGGIMIFRFFATIFNFNSLTITPPTVSTANNSVATWPWSTERSVGISYYSLQGKNNGVLYSAKISFPAYAENGSQVPLLPYLNIKIYHVPPIWAHSYQIDFTKEPTQFLFFECIDVNTTESNFLYFDITNLALNQSKNPTTAEVISWTFQEGDKVRLIRRMSDGNVPGSTYDTFVEGIVSTPIINNVTQTGKTFIKIKKLAPFSTYTYTSKFFVLQLYRPGQQPPTITNEAFYECGVQYAILNPGTATRVHAGQVTNQSTDLVTPAELNIYQGDSYFRSRTVVVSETGFGTFNVQDRNFVDFYISTVSSIDGRPLAIEENARTARFGATIRHSEAYQPYTNINGLHRFYPNNLQDCDYSAGDIKMLSTSVDRKILKVFQSNRTARIFIFSQINRQPDGTSVQVVTDKLLNPPDYYVGNFGIGTAGTSLVAHNFAHYFCDNIRGAIIRVSNDGMDVISLLYNTNSWSVVELPLRANPYFIYGGFDQKLNNYIIALEATPGSVAQTLTFSEGESEDKRPSFESFISLHPDGMVSLGTLLCSFRDGDMWTHDSTTYNNFFGIQYDSYYTPVFNDNILLDKTYQSINQRGNTKWDCPEIITSVNSYGTTPQLSNLVAEEFTLLEGKYSASFKRDVNSRGGKINGDWLKGNWVKIKIRKQSANALTTLNIVTVYYIESPLNNR